MHANLISGSNQIINTTFSILVTKLTKQGINFFSRISQSYGNMPSHLITFLIECITVCVYTMIPR